jgi:hypothetical protein
LTASPQRPEEETISRVATLIAQALAELQRQPENDVARAAREELAATRTALLDLTARLESHLADEKEQRLVLAGQLSTLAGSLDRLVDHLGSISELIADLLGKLSAQPEVVTASSTPPVPDEPAFLPGGEGLSLVLGGVPNFQALMDIQKAITALEQVAGASVERFQEGDSRILVHLQTSLTATQLSSALRSATGLNLLVEESRPELSRLRLKAVPAT